MQDTLSKGDVTPGGGWDCYSRGRECRVLCVLVSVLAMILIIWVGTLTWQTILKTQRVGQADATPYTIAIEAEGKVTGTPDIAQVQLGFEITKPDVVTAQRESTEKMNAFLAALKDKGIESKDIKTTNYSIYPDYDYSDGGRQLLGYRISQNMEVKIRDLGKISEIIGLAGQMGLNQVSGLTFTIDDVEALRDDARAKAIRRAQEKAAGIAEMMGLEVGRAVGFYESSVTPPGPYYGYYAEALSYKDAGVGAPAPQIESGSSDVTMTVVITYELK